MVHEAAPDLAEWLAVQAAEPAPPDYAELEHAAHAMYLAALPRTRPSTSSSGWTAFAVRTGVDSNSENGVVCSTLDGDPAEVIAWLRGAPAQWLISAESDLGERLVAAGCRPERTAVVMGARPRDLELGAPQGEPASTAEYQRGRGGVRLRRGRGRRARALRGAPRRPRRSAS